MRVFVEGRAKLPVVRCAGLAEFVGRAIFSEAGVFTAVLGEEADTLAAAGTLPDLVPDAGVTAVCGPWLEATTALEEFVQ